jgi:hypothetical protein
MLGGGAPLLLPILHRGKGHELKNGRFLLTLMLKFHSLLNIMVMGYDIVGINICQDS